jgi:MoxR-like ATPase
MRETAEGVYIDPDLELYIVDLVQKTREHRKIAVGASPRGGLALLKLTRAWAAMHERTYVVPDDVKIFFHPVLSHRIILIPGLWNSRVANQDILTEILNSVPVPVIQVR